jgi:MYXO-CTERM domain-containing protein
MLNGVAGSSPGNDTWEYKVTNLGNGEGCTAAFAASCASGNCVDGVCCDSAVCTGACKSCNVAGSEGTCKLVQAGTEVPASCEDGKACDGTGACKSKNGQSCSDSAACASGFCVSGICCDSACAGTCVSCGLSGHTGTCTPQPAGTDPGNECKIGTGVCKSTCDGVGACGFPGEAMDCDACNTCDGKGACSLPTGACLGSGGAGGAGGSPSSPGGTGGRATGVGGTGGMGGAATGGSATGGNVTGGSGGSSSGSGGTLGGSGGSSGSAGQGGNAVGGTGASQDGSGGSLTSGSGGSAVGSTANRDGGSAPDADVVANLHRSGCSCAVGQAQGPLSGWVPPFALVGVALFARWVRRRLVLARS